MSFARARRARERRNETRARLKAGELGLDIYDMRERLRQKGLVYRRQNEERSKSGAPEMRMPLNVARSATILIPQALKSGRIASPLLTLNFAPVAPISRAFAPMVRELKFDVCEMAIATFIQAKAHGKRLALLPIVTLARFQEVRVALPRGKRHSRARRSRGPAGGRPRL